MTYTKKEFLNDVAKEAIALKEHATEKEFDRLDFDDLEPGYTDKCIYGQMTGDCTSYRASELVLKCCKRYFANGPEFDPDKGFIKVQQHVNGESIEGIKDAIQLKADRQRMKHFSSIESYILLPGAKNKNLISFLKGEREDLKL